ncbi:hypothetical protein MMC09_003045 [Bachmanniomyces sp. S44760]|nr:hypothetical protein [Bachmanniomyces sp. S44760]
MDRTIFPVPSSYFRRPGPLVVVLALWLWLGHGSSRSVFDRDCLDPSLRHLDVCRNEDSNRAIYVRFCPSGAPEERERNRASALLFDWQYALLQHSKSNLPSGHYVAFVLVTLSSPPFEFRLVQWGSPRTRPVVAPESFLVPGQMLILECPPQDSEQAELVDVYASRLPILGKPIQSACQGSPAPNSLSTPSH